MTVRDRFAWLLEQENPSSRYLTLTQLLEHPPDNADVLAAQAAIPGWGPARAILEAQWPEGFWMRPGVGYSPKHKATVWQVIFLAALGAPLTGEIARACRYVLDNNLLPDHRFSCQQTHEGAVACLNGNLLRAMLRLGFEDRRLQEALDALAKAVVHDEYRCRFNAPSPKPALMRAGLPCAWGAIKALAAFADVPADQRTPLVQTAIELGIRLLRDGNLARGDYPTPYARSPLWQRFGFPLGHTSDVLEALEVLGRLGAGLSDPLRAAIGIVRGKMDDGGRWSLDYTPNNVWASFGRVGQPNKWVTLRALSALKLWTE